MRIKDETSVTFLKDAKSVESTIWDRPVMLARLMGDEDLARKVTEVFISDIPRQIQALGELLENGDVLGVERQAHTIKGAAANVSGEALCEMAFEMEKTARAEDLSSAKANLQELKKCFDLLKQEMDTYLCSKK